MVKQVYLLTVPAVRAFRLCTIAVYSIYSTFAHFVPWGAWTSPPFIEAQFIVPDRVDKVDYGIGLSYLPVRLHKMAGRYDNLIPLSTLSPNKGLCIWLQVFFTFYYLFPPLPFYYFLFASVMLGFLSFFSFFLIQPITACYPSSCTLSPPLLHGNRTLLGLLLYSFSFSLIQPIRPRPHYSSSFSCSLTRPVRYCTANFFSNPSNNTVMFILYS